VIKRFARLLGKAAVLQAWVEARCSGDIPGAYWAVLTHPDVGHTGLRQAFGDAHMLSHLVGAANRADIRRLTALEAENASLAAKVERQQSRLLRETGRRECLEQKAAEASGTALLWEQRARVAEAQHAAVQRELTALERHQRAADPAKEPPDLPAQRVLYVGGRPGCTEQMRASLGAAGGELLCHDGGRHDHPSLLPGLISQADRVAFPVDCVSHDAALTVKRLCRQLGKPWLPLRSAGLALFLAALAEPGGSHLPHPSGHSNAALS